MKSISSSNQKKAKSSILFSLPTQYQLIDVSQPNQRGNQTILVPLSGNQNAGASHIISKAELLFDSLDDTEAISLLTDFIDNVEKDNHLFFDVCYHLALRLKILERYTEAEIYINKALIFLYVDIPTIVYETKKKLKALCWLELGRILKGLNNLLKAKRCFDKSIRILPLPQTFNSLGLLCRETGEVGLAETYYREAIKLRPTDALYYDGRGLLKKKLKLYLEADNDFQKALELDPKKSPI